MHWTEGNLHVAMRRILNRMGWLLVAGEYPGGSDHQLYSLNVVDPEVARDDSPDPRRHSTGELIPDLVALRHRDLLISEAKLAYSASDLAKLEKLLGPRLADLQLALEKFARERDFPALLPIDTLVLHPTLVFLAGETAPAPPEGFSYMRVQSQTEAFFDGALAGSNG